MKNKTLKMSLKICLYFRTYTRNHYLSLSVHMYMYLSVSSLYQSSVLEEVDVFLQERAHLLPRPGRRRFRVHL